MTDPFRLTTGDPRFNPDKPVTVNGYLYLPPSERRQKIVPGRTPNKPVVEVKRKREAPWPGDRLLDADGTLLPGTSMDIGSRQHVRRVGKRAAGRLLDGKIHDARPEVNHG